MCEISNSLKSKLLSLVDPRNITDTIVELTPEETSICWPSSRKFNFLSEKYLTTHVVSELKGSFPVDSDDTGFVGHSGFQDSLHNPPFKEFQLENRKFFIQIPYGYFGNSVDPDDSLFNVIIDDIQKEIFRYCVHTIFELAGEPYQIGTKPFISTNTPLVLTWGAEEKLMNDHKLQRISGNKFVFEGREAEVIPDTPDLIQILSEDARTAFRIFRFSKSEIQRTMSDKDKGVEISFEINMDIQVNNENKSILFNVDK
ncbi:hypothetical protein Q7Q91_16005 [Lactiplantibacillus pentosus]|uniref:hypothetical protein n=1 Tax=Lactiplantibacillus pentosus TaxID=1589 RepID=UPI002701F8F0|nr:hypothetical protein [Lactiplantibacillus pentosus]MDO7806493.1 hypothetical protein [Lactiplantibacillus pentosus]